MSVVVMPIVVFAILRHGHPATFNFYDLVPGEFVCDGYGNEPLSVRCPKAAFSTRSCSKPRAILLERGLPCATRQLSGPQLGMLWSPALIHAGPDQTMGLEGAELGVARICPTCYFSSTCSKKLNGLRIPEAPNAPFFWVREKNAPISARPPKQRSPPEKRSTKSPSSIQRKAGIVTFLKILPIFALVLHFDFCSLLSDQPGFGKNARSRKKCTFTIFW